MEEMNKNTEVEQQELDRVYMENKEIQIHKENVQLILQQFNENKNYKPSIDDCMAIGKYNALYPDKYDKLRSFIKSHSEIVLSYKHPIKKFKLR